MDEILTWVARELDARGRLLLAIDGRCGGGKSTLAAALARELGGNVFHTDDFYLPFARRAADWTGVPAGNMDLERLRRELLLPLRAGETVLYRAYDCPRDRFRETLTVPFRPLSIVEGSYSQHPLLRELYDLRLFVTVAPERQLERLRRREGAHAAAFEALWIPMEERYFAACGIEEAADRVTEVTVQPRFRSPA